MTDDTKKEAWRRRCSQLEALGIDTYDPQFPADEERRLQVQAILKEYDVAIGKVIPVPSGWEGSPPLRAINNLADLAGWLNDQWTSIRQTEMGGETYQADVLNEATQAVRNASRVLARLGVDDRPERPLPAETLALAKQQFDDLERWVKQKLKEGWMPPPAQPEEDIPATTNKRRKRSELPDDYEANILIKRFLDQNPKATIREVAPAVGLSVGKVDKMDAWRREMARREATKPQPKNRERQLTDKMLKAIGRENDPAIKKAMKDEAIWRWLVEEAKPNEKVNLHMMTDKERTDLIELVRGEYDEAHAEPDD